MEAQLRLDQFAHFLPTRQDTITNSTKPAHNETWSSALCAGAGAPLEEECAVYSFLITVIAAASDSPSQHYSAYRGLGRDGGGIKLHTPDALLHGGSSRLLVAQRGSWGPDGGSGSPAAAPGRPTFYFYLVVIGTPPNQSGRKRPEPTSDPGFPRAGWLSGTAPAHD